MPRAMERMTSMCSCLRVRKKVCIELVKVEASVSLKRVGHWFGMPGTFSLPISKLSLRSGLEARRRAISSGSLEVVTFSRPEAT